MARYIDADKLEKDFPQSVPKHNVIINGNEYPVFLVDHILHKIRNYPTADVVEVKHGEWIKEGCCFYCSECKKTYGFGSTQTIYDVKRRWLHCPNCGAKMDGGKTE